MSMLRHVGFLLVLLAGLSSGRTVAQEALQPEPMVDPLRPIRTQQRDAWEKLYEQLTKEPDAATALPAAWALFHQFDVDYFYLLEEDAAGMLVRYEKTTTGLRKKLAEVAMVDSTASLAVMELDALLDDFNANRLQDSRPEGQRDDAPEVKAWNTKFDQFQLTRARAQQERGKLVLTLYRSGKVDVARLCIILLERQIAERMLLEHQEMIAGPKNVARYTARRKILFDKQRQEWKQLRDLLPDTTASRDQIALGEQICALHMLTLDLLQARLAVPTDAAARKVADENVAAIAKKVFAAYQELHRAAAAKFAEGKINVEQFARFHDLRMYTTIWIDASLNATDVVAEGFEVAEVWARLHEQLAKTDPEGRDTLIALAKKLETEATRLERQGAPPAKDETKMPTPAAK